MCLSVSFLPKAIFLILWLTFAFLWCIFIFSCLFWVATTCISASYCLERLDSEINYCVERDAKHTSLTRSLSRKCSPPFQFVGLFSFRLCRQFLWTNTKLLSELFRWALHYKWDVPFSRLWFKLCLSVPVLGVTNSRIQCVYAYVLNGWVCHYACHCSLTCNKLSIMTWQQIASLILMNVPTK